MFSTLEKARRFIRQSLEGNPHAYLDLVEDGGGSLPVGLREGEYSVIEEKPDELAEMGTQMGIHGMLLDPGPGENYPIPLSAPEPGLDPEGDYFVLRFRRGPEAGSCFHYANHRGEEVLPVFTTLERVSEFLEEHARVNTGHLNALRKDGVDNVITPKRPVAGGLLKDETGQPTVGKLSPVVETLAVIAAGSDIRYVVIDPGKLDGSYLELPPQAA